MGCRTVLSGTPKVPERNSKVRRKSEDGGAIFINSILHLKSVDLRSPPTSRPTLTFPTPFPTLKILATGLYVDVAFGDRGAL